MTPIQVLLATANIGGRLRIAADGTLRMVLPADCAPELKAAIRAHKAALLDLLPLNFLIVQSDTLKAAVLWAADEETKQRLIAAGAEQGSIYTPAELDQLLRRRVTVAELPAIHMAKRTFNGRVKGP